MAARLLTACLGIWLMAAPAIFQYSGLPADNDRIIGPLTVAFAIIAIFPATHSLRWINLILGLWLIAASWLLHPHWPLLLNDLLAGLAIIALALIPLPSREHLGSGWSGLLG